MEHKYADVVLHQAWPSVVAHDLQTERGKLEVKILMQKEGMHRQNWEGGILTKADIKQLDVNPMEMKKLNQFF